MISLLSTNYITRLNCLKHAMSTSHFHFALFLWYILHIYEPTNHVFATGCSTDCLRCPNVSLNITLKWGFTLFRILITWRNSTLRRQKNHSWTPHAVGFNLIYDLWYLSQFGHWTLNNIDDLATAVPWRLGIYIYNTISYRSISYWKGFC